MLFEKKRRTYFAEQGWYKFIISMPVFNYFAAVDEVGSKSSRDDFKRRFIPNVFF